MRRFVAIVVLLAFAATAADMRLCDKTNGSRCASVNGSGQVSIAGSIAASTTGRATASAPSYSEGTDNPLSLDLSGNIRTLATAQTAAAATAADPSYTEGSTSPLSQDLAGYLRVRGVFWQTTQPVSGTFWPTTAGAPASIRLSDGAAFYDARSIRLLTSSDVVDVSDRSGRALGTIANTSFNVGNFPATYDTSDRAARLLGVVYGSQAQQLKQTAVNFNLQSELAVGGSLIDPRSIRALTSSDTVTTAPPADASTNVTKWAGTAVDTNSGTKSAGTLRVVIATDQPALTNKLLVTPDSVALPANQSVNVAQFGGNATVTGTGAGGVGIPRVTISNDSSLAANQSVNLAQVGGTNTLTGGTAGSLGVGGLAAAGGASSGNPVYTAYRDTAGVAVPIICDKSAFINPTTATTTQIVALSGSTVIYVCAYEVNFVGSATANTGIFKYGTGAACATGPVSISATFFGPTATGGGSQFNMGHGIGYLFKTIAGQALCFTTSGATTAGVMVSYAQF